MTTESSYVIWGEFKDRNGNKVSVTIREGATWEKVADGLALWDHLAEHCQFLGFSPIVSQKPESPPTPAKPARSPEVPAGVSTRAPEKDQTSGINLVEKLVIRHVSDDVFKVDFYVRRDPSKFPKYPIFEDFSESVAAALLTNYNLSDKELAWLYKEGQITKKDWIVEWENTDKLNSKGNPYKRAVRIWKLEDYGKETQ